MPRATVRIVVCLAAPCVACACASSPDGPQPARQGFAGRSARAGLETFDVARQGMGGAIRAPLSDFNFAHPRIPAALHRAAAAPYAMDGLDDCAAITAEIATLDLALGPDFDTPDVERSRDIYARGAGLVADAALDAVRHATVGYIPMRSVVRRLSGAEKLERRMRRAELAGAVRRGFLKAMGLQRGCGWPAAPLGAQLRIPLPAAVLARLAAPAPDVPPSPPQVVAARPVELMKVTVAASGAGPLVAPTLAASAGEGAGSASRTLVAAVGER